MGNRSLYAAGTRSGCHWTVPSDACGSYTSRRGASALLQVCHDLGRGFHRDPDRMEWVHEREHFRHVVLTLCRMLYSLRTGRVTSKSQAARWMLQTEGREFAEVIHVAIAGRDEPGEETDGQVERMLALAERIAQEYHEWNGQRQHVNHF